MNEVTWNWEAISIALLWKLAPSGLVLRPTDLTLPRDRVLAEHREVDRLRLEFVTLDTAKMLAAAERGEIRATVSELRGSWQQIAVVMCWKLAKDGVTLSAADIGAVPAGLELLRSSHPDGVEWRFLGRSEAARLARRLQDHEGRKIREGDT